MDKMTDTALNAASNILSRVPDSALGLSTGVLAAFMISIRLPKLKKTLENWLPQPIREKYLPAILELRHSVGGWLLAQLKLSGVTALILLAGFWALQIPLFPVWALLVAFVDALPVLGTGAVLLPWSLICFLQGQNMRGLGLLGVYALVWLIRSVLEPRLVGNELGLDPLVTLLSMYAGYKLFGLIGMILSPVVAVCAIRLAGIFRQ
jgi:sporulation integral membrane protein YtvI